MDSILILIQPKHCWKIIHGWKTIEIRKIRPDSETPFKCFIYCTKKYILELRKNGKLIRLDGKVIGEFICEKIEQLSEKDYLYGLLHISDLKIYDKPKELSRFIVPSKSGCVNKGKCSGCIYFDKGNGFNIEDDCTAPFCTDEYKPLRRPPQSWCYVSELKGDK